MSQTITAAATSVRDALYSRRTTRAFTAEPVADETLRELLRDAARAPSGGNLQPWAAYVLNGDATDAFRARIREAMKKQPFGEPPEYPVYPEALPDPFRSRRRDIGEQLYGSLGIAREDKAARMQQFARNFELFGAPAVVFFAVERIMNVNQWAHLGMFQQSFMLAARERGLHTCPQESWAVWHREVATFCAIPDSQMLHCGIAIGHADADAAVNQMHSPRADLASFARFIES